MVALGAELLAKVRQTVETGALDGWGPIAAMGPEPADLDPGRLRAALADLGDQPLEWLCDALIERLRHERLQDDIALVAIRLHPQGWAGDSSPR